MVVAALRNVVAKTIARSGYELRRADGSRRNVLFHNYGVDLVFDVGAAVGRYGQELRRFGFGGRIISIEPLATAFSVLSARASKDPNWEVVHSALGSTPGTAEIHVAGNSDSSSLLPMLDRHLRAAPHTKEVRKEQIDITTLDLLAAEYPLGQRPFVKIDTQGFEGAVLDGAERMLDMLVGAQLELSFVPLYAGGILYDDALSRMSDLGFSLVNLEPGFRDPITQQLLQADATFFRV